MSLFDDIRTTFTNIPDENIPGMVTLLNNIVTTQSGVTTTGATQGDALELLAGTYNSLVGTTSTAKALQATSDASASTGASYTDLFERTSSTNLGSDWTMSYSGAGSGTLATADGHNAAWILGSDARQADAFYTPTSGGFTLTDYQKTTIVLSTYPETQISSPFTYPVNYLYGRADVAGTTYVYAAVRRGSSSGYLQVELGYVVSGTKTVWATQYAAATNSVTLQCGTGNGSRFFAVLDSQGRTLLEYNDASSASQMGASYRYGGLGFSATAPTATPTAQKVPGKVNAWTFTDATVTPSYGSGCMVSRTTTGNIAGGSSANLFVQWSNAWADTFDYSSADVIYDTGTNLSRFKVYTPGWYLMQARCHLVVAGSQTAQSTTVQTQVTVVWSGTSVRNYQCMYPTASTNKIMDQCLVYVPAASAATPATVTHKYQTPVTNAAVGSDSNEETYQILSRISP